MKTIIIILLITYSFFAQAAHKKVKTGANSISVTITPEMKKSQIDSIITLFSKSKITLNFRSLRYNCDGKIERLAVSASAKNQYAYSETDNFHLLTISAEHHDLSIKLE